MRQRGDFTCFHEPFMYYYYVHLGVKKMPYFEIDPAQPTGFDEVISQLFDAAELSPVFFKDMSYYVIPAIYEHAQLAQQMVHVFLIRDPRRSIPSFYKLDPDLQLEEIGLEAQWRHANWLRGLTGEPPIVLEAEAIQRDPRGIMGELWDSLGLPFVEEAFAWHEHQTPEDWQQVAGWHQTAAASRGIESPLVEEDATIQTKFDEIASTAPYLSAYLDHHWPFYQGLRKFALTG